VLLAFTSVAALAGAVLALLPTLARRRPVGRVGARRAEDGASERDVTTDPLIP
jgi:hypothetical protein